MKRIPLARRSAGYYWRANLALMLGVFTGAATLTGALLVGDSIRGSLRDRAVARLGDVVSVTRDSRFRSVNPPMKPNGISPVGPPEYPAIMIDGVATCPATKRRENQVHLYGLPGSFPELPHLQNLGEREVVINDALAEQLTAAVGDDLIFTLRNPSPIPAETLLGRRDAQPRRVRLTIAAIVDSDGFGGFALQPRQTRPANAFLLLQTLQRVLDVGDTCNARFLRSPADAKRLRSAWAMQNYWSTVYSSLAWRTWNDDWSFVDFGLRVRMADHAIVLESESLLLAPPLESLIRTTASRENLLSSPVISYLANEIARVDPRTGDIARSIPYSTVAAIETGSFVVADLPNHDRAGGNLDLAPGRILLNAWAADQLDASRGDTIRLTYYVLDDFGELRTEHADFRLSGVVALEPAGVDPTFTPQYPGVTDSDRIRDWDPPFPVDLKRIRDEDEAYWDAYRAAPKAFIALEDGERLWADKADRFGKYTSIRIRSGNPNRPLAEVRAAFEKALAQQATPETLGFLETPVFIDALRASRGSTDFSGLFIGFGLFLIASAAMLVALLFRLNLERRASQIGLLLATGFSTRQVRALLLREAMWLAAAGSVLGLGGAVGYAWLMITGLRTWWAAAANAPFLTLHVTGESLAFGFVLSIAVAYASTRVAMRGLLHRGTRALLAGGAPSTRRQLRPRASTLRSVGMIGSIAAAGALLIVAVRLDGMEQAGAFFGCGALLLAAALCFVAGRLTFRECRSIGGSSPPSRSLQPGPRTIDRLAWRNAARHRGRSLTTVALLASATFVIVSLGAFRLNPDADVSEIHGPAGGYTMFAESTLPILRDLNSPQGRRALDLPDEAIAALEGVTITPFRLREGDTTSCLNLYAPTEPRIIGAPPRQVERDGFRFAGVMPPANNAVSNPWALLDVTLPDGAIPAFGDEAAVQWQLHSGLGKSIVVTSLDGEVAQLRFVGLLRNSPLQDEIIISEADFKRSFPAIDGYRFFLIDAPVERSDAVASILEQTLGDYGFDVGSTSARLRDYLAVQNTYITTFQTLGGLGLGLGAFGIVAVLLRNIWERRSELALMQALGFARGALVRYVLAENAMLVATGLLCGVLPAMLAIAPTLLRRPDDLSWASLAASVGAVVFVGVGVGFITTRAALRTPLIPALRRE